MRRGYRIIGWWFIAIGGFMLLITLRLYMDPNGEITYNGVATTSPDLKLNAVLFTSMFPIIGAVLAFLPKRLFRKLFCWQLKLNPFSIGWGTKKA
jgi:hypothetical protein